MTMKTISLHVASGLAAVSFVAMTGVPSAGAHVVEAVAAVPVQPGGSEQELDRAVQAAIDDVATHAIAFTPTVVTVLDAKVVADQIYLFVLLADEAGEESLRLLMSERPPAGPGFSGGPPARDGYLEYR